MTARLLYLGHLFLCIVALALFVIYPFVYLLAVYLWARSSLYPVRGHPNIVVVEISNSHIDALYFSFPAIQAMQKLINSPLPLRKPLPIGDENNSGGLSAHVKVTFYYRFSQRSARAKIYGLPAGVFVVLYHHANCPSKLLFVGGKSAANYRRLFRPFLSSSGIAVAHRRHLVF